MTTQFILDDELYSITTEIVFILGACRYSIVWRRWIVRRKIIHLLTAPSLSFRFSYLLCVTYFSTNPWRAGLYRHLSYFGFCRWVIRFGALMTIPKSYLLFTLFMILHIAVLLETVTNFGLCLPSSDIDEIIGFCCAARTAAPVIYSHWDDWNQ